MADGFRETPVKGLHGTNTAAPDATAVLVLPAIANAAVPAYTEGNVVLLSTDLTGNLRVTLASGEVEIKNDTGNPIPTSLLVGGSVVSAGNPVPVGLEVAGAAVAAGNPVPTVLEVSGAPASAANPLPVDLSQGGSLVAAGNGLPVIVEVSGAPATTANPVPTALSVGGTAVSAAAPLPVGLEVAGSAVAAGNPVPVGLEIGGAAVTAGNPVPVNVEIGGAVNSATNPIFDAPVVRGAVVSDTNPLPVLMQENPGTLTDTTLTSASLAAGASTDLEDAALVGALVGKLVEVTASSSVRCKVQIKTVTSGSVATTKRTFFIDPSAAPLIYKTSDLDTIVAPALGHLRVTITNIDNLNAADVYASITRVEV